MLIDSLKNKQTILASFLQISAMSGWNLKNLEEALDLVNIDKKYLSIIFPNGILDVIDFYIKEGNKELAKKISYIEDFDQQKIRDKIRLCLYKRFEIEINNKKSVNNLVHFYFDPKNLSSFSTGLRPSFQSLELCFSISDSIWKIIKDQSTDFNFYSKRLILSKIIWKTSSIFINDESENLTNTKKYIDNEIKKIMQFEK